MKFVFVVKSSTIFMLLLLLAFAIGVVIGCAAGLLPSVHPNNTIPIVLAAASFFDPLSAAIILVTAGVINSFIAFIPSVLVGAPDEAEALSVLPGHRMLLQGRGLEAIRLTALGGLGAIVLGIVLLPLLAFVMPPVYSAIKPNTHWLLAAAVLFLLFCEPNVKKMLSSLLIFGLAGILGFVVLDVMVVDNGILPLLTGLFGVPTLLIALREKLNLPETLNEKRGKEKTKLFPGIATGAAAGILAGLLPGIGSSQAAMLIQGKDSSEKGMRKFLVALGGVSAADVLYSLFALWLIGNARSGIAIAVGQLIKVGVKEIAIFSVVGLVAGFVGFWLTIFLSKHVLSWLKKVNYQHLCAAVLVLITSLVAIMSGVVGLLILGTATGIGLLGGKLGVRRSWAMGCLIVPTILFFAGFVQLTSLGQ